MGGRWPTAEAARSSLADFAACKSIQKFAARPALALSQTFGVDAALRSDGILKVEVHRHAELDVRALGIGLESPRIGIAELQGRVERHR